MINVDRLHQAYARQMAGGRVYPEQARPPREEAYKFYERNKRQAEGRRLPTKRRDFDDREAK